jgi:oligosaccharide repeat unit polymerase
LRGVRVIELRSAFSPLSLVAFFYLPLLAFYLVASPRILEEEFASRKAVTWVGIAYFALSLLLFAAGAKVGGDTARARGRDDRDAQDEPVGPAQRRAIAVVLEVALVVSVAAYAVWFSLGFVRAGGIASFFRIWRNDPFRIKTEILATLPGVTTLAQLAVAAIPLAIAFGFHRRGSVIRSLIGITLALGAARAFLFSERLALIELVVPIAFLVLAPKRLAVPRVVLYAFTLVVAAMVFFMATELRRSYAYTHNFSIGRSETRFLGYYLTSVNNGMAVAEHYRARTPFYSSGQFVWLLPGVRSFDVDNVTALGTVSFRYADLFGVDPDTFWPRAFASQGLSYEFNVFTAPGFLAADFGWLGLAAVFLFGLISARLYARTKESSYHRALYALWLVGLFEFMRILYVTNTRIFPAYLVFGAVYLVRKGAYASADRVRVGRPSPESP